MSDEQRGRPENGFVRGNGMSTVKSAEVSMSKTVNTRPCVLLDRNRKDVNAVQGHSIFRGAAQGWRAETVRLGKVFFMQKQTPWGITVVAVRFIIWSMNGVLYIIYIVFFPGTAKIKHVLITCSLLMLSKYAHAFSFFSSFTRTFVQS